MIVLATLFGALLAAAAPASVEPTFSRAYIRDLFNRDSLCFESPVDLDWEAIARREFKEFPIDSPPRDKVLGNGFEPAGASYFTFSAALPDALSGLHFYLIAEAGMRPIVPKRLSGMIYYKSYKKNKIEPPGFGGTICLPVPKGVDDAGFVATSKVPLSWQREPATLVRSDSTTRVQLQNGSAILPPPGISESPIEVKSAYILSSAELAAKYVLVRRVVDPTNCEFTYDIYRWEKGLPVIASNPHNCDV